MKTKNKINLGIITFPADGPSKGQLSRLIQLCIPLSNEIHVLTGNEAYTDLNYSEVSFYGLFHTTGKTALSRVLRYSLTQMKISYYFFKLSKKADIWVFVGGGETLVIPMIISFFLRKKTVLVIGGSMEDDNKLKRNMNNIYSNILIIFKRISLLLSSKLILYSPNLIERWNLSNYKEKILIANIHFFNLNDLELKNYKSGKKKFIIGYVGRLSEEKGVMNFVKALPTLLKKYDVQVLICGDGPLLDEIDDHIKKNNLEKNVILTGWIAHDKIYSYLKQLKLLILPSYTEGLPKIMLESMACGTPVLSTSVGAVPEIICDGYNGFIMEDNSPEIIAENIKRVIKRSDLEKIAENAYNTVKNDFNYDDALKNWEYIFNNIH